MIDSTSASAGFLAVLVACAVLVPGIAMLLRRRDPLGFCTALLGSGLATAVAGLLSVATHTITWPWYLSGVLAIYLSGIVAVAMWGWRPSVRFGADVQALLGAAVAMSTGIVFVLRAPVQWDARSIWFFHGSWFADPSTIYLQQASQAEFSHPDYPPLAPSFSAFAWLFGDNSNDWIPQVATAVLALAAIAILGVIVGRQMSTASGRVALGAVAAFCAMAVTRGNGLDGYVDGISAVLIAILAASALVPVDKDVVVIVAAAAAMTKNETLVFLVIVIVPVFLLMHRSVAPLVPGIAIGVTWRAVMMASDVASTSWQFGNVLPWSSGFTNRIGTILTEFASDRVLAFGIVLYIGSLLVAWAAGGPRESRTPLLVMGGIGLGLGLLMALFYLATPYDLLWHLDRSADRLLMHSALAFCVGSAIGLGTLWANGAPQDVDTAVPAHPKGSRRRNTHIDDRPGVTHGDQPR